MTSKKGTLSDLLENTFHQRIVLGLGVVFLVLLEIVIYVAAAGQAGHTSLLVITDNSGRKVYETPGKTLTTYEQMLFEDLHGPLENYQVHVQTQSHPFPTRIWLSSAVGIPIGLILLTAFLVRAYMALVYGESERGGGKRSLPDEASGLKWSLVSFRGISIFHVGLVFVIGTFLFWLVPEFLLNLVKISLTAVREFKWLALGLAVFLAFIVMWVIYLRYKLSKQMLDNQFNLEKFRLEHELLEHKDSLLLPEKIDGIYQK